MSDRGDNYERSPKNTKITKTVSSIPYLLQIRCISGRGMFVKAQEEQKMENCFKVVFKYSALHVTDRIYLSHNFCRSCLCVHRITFI